jgi:signal transduction histidine kinase
MDAATPDPRSVASADVPGLVLDELPVGVLVFDQDLRVVRSNPAAERLIGGVRAAAEMPAGPGQGGGPDWEAGLRRVIDLGVPAHRDVAVPGTGSAPERLLEVHCTPLPGGGGAGAVGVVLTVEDVSGRAGLERRLAVSERLAAVGKLAARVAHELNNPLDGILRYINLAARLLDGTDHEKVVGYLAESRKGLMRMAQILSELLEYSRGGRSQYEEADINRTVEEAVRALQVQADRAGVTVACAFRSDQMPVLRGGMLFQVCCNLIKNAIDAMPGGGRLTVTTAVTDNEVLLRFEDTGPGLPEPVEQVFEPFFTTKGAGEGTGLGLAICKDYVERLHGRITAEQADPNGAVFTVHIPRASCLPDPPRRAEP